jgi:hypothetical protein
VAITVAALNDTDITTCGNEIKWGLACPVAGYPGQDGQSGRDVTSNNNADGHAGFSFTKISSKGAVLPASATSWNCVKDNVTGLVWEVKTDNGGLHDKDWSYKWYEPDGTKNGGIAGFAAGKGFSCGKTSECDTYAYVKAVNAAGWCGAKDWRMPTVDELFSIASLNRINPSIDIQYFPNTLSTVSNTVSMVYWSSSSFATGDGAWGVDFNFGRAFWASFESFMSVEDFERKSNFFFVRLVHNGQ